MTSIYLIRHGQASFGQENYDKLSPLGEQQASHLGNHLAQRLGAFERVTIGGMFRHKQTAQHCLSNMHDAPHSNDWHSHDGWNEYDHQDILAQHAPECATAAGTEDYVKSQPNPKAFFETMFNNAMARWMSGEHDADYVESWSDYQGRIEAALRATIEAHQDAKSVAVFTSGGPIAVVSQKLLGVPAERIMRMNWTLLNCGVTKLVSTGNRLFVASLNDHAHFEGEHKSLMTYK